MPPRPHPTSKVFRYILVLLVICIVILVLNDRQVWQPAPPESEIPPAPKPKKMSMTIKPQAVIDFNRLSQDQALAQLMQQRKAQYGVDKGVDLLLQPDEILKIDDMSIPMAEILDKIRLTRGDVLSKELPVERLPDAHSNREKEFLTVLGQKEARLLELEAYLRNPLTTSRQNDYEDKVEELVHLQSSLKTYRQYMETLSALEAALVEIEAADDLTRAQLDKRIRELEQQLADLEAQMDLPTTPLQKSRVLAEHHRQAERIQELENHLQDPATVRRQEAHRRKLQEHAELQALIDLYRNHRHTAKALEEYIKILPVAGPGKQAELQAKIGSLEAEKLRIEERLAQRMQEGHKIEVYGIYMVQPGDNIWNIHFEFLKDYLARKQIRLSAQADEPTHSGFSSGVGKLLKFSERMVYIFNIKERKIDQDLNLLAPKSKIVIFNMDQVFSLLEEIDYARVSHIRFDGQTLWIPGEP